MKPITIFLAFFVAVIATSPLSAAPSTRSGQYDALTLAVVDGAVTGAFFDARGPVGPGGSPQFRCVFLLRGRLQGDRAKIATWAPAGKERIAGELVFKGDDVMIKLVKNQQGCQSTGDDIVGQFYKASRITEGAEWIGVAMVSAKRAAFRPAPDAPAPRRPYVIKDDPVVILARDGDWVRVSYVGGGKPVTGWLRRDELVSDYPPAGSVRVENEGATSSAVANWIGVWTCGDQQEIDIKPAPGGGISLDGSASWGGGDPARAASGAVNVGEISATVIPKGNKVAFTLEGGQARPYDALPENKSLCRMKLWLLGSGLKAEDNGSCGGLNVTFSGTYHREKRAP